MIWEWCHVIGMALIFVAYFGQGHPWFALVWAGLLVMQVFFVFILPSMLEGG
jgi:hypothetical protein